MVTRPREVVEKTSYVFNGDAGDCVAELSDLLSSPFSSYKASEDPGQDPQNPVRKFTIQHRQGPYQARLKSTKANLRDEIQIIRSEREQDRLKTQMLQDELKDMRDVTIDWETRSRVCQAINDKYMEWPNIWDLAALLEAKGFDYLPYIISLWAIHTGQESATRFLDEIDPVQWSRYERKANQLDDSGECLKAVQDVWNALLSTDRDLMIAMWLTRPTSRTSIAHPIPTVNQGISIINLDDRLSPEEKSVAQQIIPEAVDKYLIPLFIAPK